MKTHFAHSHGVTYLQQARQLLLMNLYEKSKMDMKTKMLHNDQSLNRESLKSIMAKDAARHSVINNMLDFWSVASGNDLEKLALRAMSGTLSETDREMLMILARETQALAKSIDTHYADLRDGQLIPANQIPSVCA